MLSENINVNVDLNGNLNVTFNVNENVGVHCNVNVKFNVNLLSLSSSLSNKLGWQSKFKSAHIFLLRY